MISTINIGNISIHLYSLCLLVGILLASFLILKEANKQKLDKDLITNMLIYTVIFGIIGARIYYVIFNYDYYLNRPLSIFKIWEGGLAIHGGIIGGLLFIIYYTKKHDLNLLKILDILVIGLIIAQSIGRWGNFFNGEAHGPVTTLDVLNNLYLPQFIIEGMNINGNYYIPTFFYESIWCVIGFILLIVIRKRKKLIPGILTAIYLIWYGIGRFIIEIFRTDSLMIFNLKTAQLISLIMIIIGIYIIIRRTNLWKKQKS